MRSDSVKNMSAYADQNHAPSLVAARLEVICSGRIIHKGYVIYQDFDFRCSSGSYYHCHLPRLILCITLLWHSVFGVAFFKLSDIIVSW